MGGLLRRVVDNSNLVRAQRFEQARLTDHERARMRRMRSQVGSCCLRRGDDLFKRYCNAEALQLRAVVGRAATSVVRYQCDLDPELAHYAEERAQARQRLLAVPEHAVHVHDQAAHFGEREWNWIHNSSAKRALKRWNTKKPMTKKATHVNAVRATKSSEVGCPQYIKSW